MYMYVWSKQMLILYFKNLLFLFQILLNEGTGPGISKLKTTIFDNFPLSSVGWRIG